MGNKVSRMLWGCRCLGSPATRSVFESPQYAQPCSRQGGGQRGWSMWCLEKPKLGRERLSPAQNIEVGNDRRSSLAE